MKFLLALLSLITLSKSYGEEFFQTFDDRIKNAYSEYVVMEHYDEHYPYGIKLVKGIMKGEVRYGFCFYSNEPGAYYVRVSYNDKTYRLPTVPRGDVQAVALNFKEGDTFSILVFDSRNGIQEPLSAFENIKIISKKEFNQLENKEVGQGEGAGLTNFRTYLNMSPEVWFYVAAGVILLVCGIVLFIYYKKRQGLFNKEIRSKNVFNFREFISSNFEIPNEEAEQYLETEYEVISDDDVAEEVVEPEKSTYFEEHYSWARDEEERSGFDIRDYLRNKGYVTDYDVLSESEKNQIMLELMRLKDEGRITRDEYLEETVKLWKK